MERLCNIGMIAIDDETGIVSHGPQAVSRLATSAFQSLNVIRFFQYFVLEFMAGRSNPDMLSWYLGLAGQRISTHTRVVVFARFFIAMMKSAEFLYPCTRYDINVMNNVLQDTPYLHYQDATYGNHNDV